ncbi:MAG: response regulator [Planctomycetes bacterium]|nr:response regulator [Planctomycetota bacterium]MCD7897866.1 response regulator [Planctomycetaceae bacterium]
MEKIYIICVDDQRDVLSSVLRDLRPFSEWTILEECESADEALDVLHDLEITEKPLGLIVCDHIMPGTLGVDFLAKVEKSRHFRHVKKILMTGQATHQDTINAINFAKIDAYIEKPWDGEKLRETVRRLLTEYVFDVGMDPLPYRSVLDPDTFMARTRSAGFSD